MSNTKLIGVGIVLFILSIILLSTCTKVGPKEAAFRVNNAGDYRGVQNIPLVTGFQFYIPGIQHIEKVGTTQHHVVWATALPEDKEIISGGPVNIFCYGGAGFMVDVGLNVSVIASEAPRMWLRWKEVDVPDIMNKFIRNTVRGSMQAISSTYTVDSVLNNFSQLETACRTAVTDSLRHYGFAVDGFNFISKPKAIDPALESSINRKIIAKQDAETKVMELQSSIAEANKEMAKARGDSAAKVISAAGEAEAIRLKQKEITSTYVDYIRAQRWDGKLPYTMLGSGTNTLLNLK